ncbi:MAG: Mut7-C RNAse domain-containing protein [bacterium]|nr:Mut7-C RNAse domain-containing protein [bacterium]
MELKFIVDNMLGRLAKWLRIAGYDTLYFNSIEDDKLIDIALKENRIILTRDTRLIKRKLVKNYILINNDFWNNQLKELSENIKLDLSSNILTRCVFCNDILSQIEKEKVINKVPPYVFETQNIFLSCPKCERIFWQGTHFAEIKKVLNNIIPSS